MTTFTEELRRARENNNISLAEISRSTRINVQQLEALDQGLFDILPQAYIRAFIREYARTVGLSPEDILQKYDIFVKGKFTTGQSQPSSVGWMTGTVPVLHEPAHDTKAPPTNEFLIKQRSMRTIVIIAGIVLLCALVLAFVANYIWVLRSTPTVGETPFQDIVREKEAQASRHDAERNGTAPGGASAQPDSANALTLTIRSSASVWMSIMRDDSEPIGIFMEAGQQRVLHSRERFTITIGNGSGAIFNVNGKDIGVLGATGAIIQNIVITAEGVNTTP